MGRRLIQTHINSTSKAPFPPTSANVQQGKGGFDGATMDIHARRAWIGNWQETKDKIGGPQDI